MRMSARKSALAVAAMVVSLLFFLPNPAQAEIQALWGAEVVVNGEVQKEGVQLSDWQGYGRTNGYGYKGSDGSFFAYYRHRYSIDGDLTWLKKVSADGGLLWEKVVYTGGSAIIDFVPDSSGGGIAVLVNGADIRAKRYDSSGNEDLSWGADGIPVATAVSGSVHISYAKTDEADGAIVMWSDSSGVNAQRIGSDGLLKWDSDLATPAIMDPVWVGGGRLSRSCAEENNVVKDGSGGVFIAWRSKVYDEPTSTWINDVHVQHLDSSGQIKWQSGGVAVPGSTDRRPGDVVPDGTGGVIVALRDSPIIINRVDNSGAAPWGNGILVQEDDYGYIAAFLEPVGNGEFVIVWDTYIYNGSSQDSYVYARKFDLSGNPLWANDVLVHTTGFDQLYMPQVESDGSNGVWVGFHDSDYENGLFYGESHVSVNHIDNAGNLHQSAPYRQWAFAGSDLWDYYIIPDGTGGIFSIWDGYNGDMGAQRFGKSRPVTIDIVPGSTQNVINILSHGTVMVAVLSEADFDALTIDGATVLFADAPVASSFSHDVNTDGITDMIYHFDIQSLNLDETSTSAKLTGTTLGGDGFEGEDSVTIVGGQGGGGGGGGPGQ